MSTLADKIRPHVKDIVAAHKAGDESATQIITLYEMHCRSPYDPGAPALCEATFDDWMKARSGPSKAEALNARERT